jgi:hypothetical protein
VVIAAAGGAGACAYSALPVTDAPASRRHMPPMYFFKKVGCCWMKLLVRSWRIGGTEHRELGCKEKMARMPSKIPRASYERVIHLLEYTGCVCGLSIFDLKILATSPYRSAEMQRRYRDLQPTVSSSLQRRKPFPFQPSRKGRGGACIRNHQNCMRIYVSCFTFLTKRAWVNC